LPQLYLLDKAYSFLQCGCTRVPKSTDHRLGIRMNTVTCYSITVRSISFYEKSLCKACMVYQRSHSEM